MANEYSDPHKNYLRLEKTIAEIQSNDFKPTLEWYCSHYNHIVQYSSIMGEFMDSHTDNPAILLRLQKVAQILETLLNQYATTGFFDYRGYLLVNQTLHILINEIWKEDELLELLSKMEM